MSSSELPQNSRSWRLPRPKLHVIYFVLAAVDLLTICGGFYLTHQLMGIYQESVSTNQDLADRLADFAKLGDLAQLTNAPGNDVFDSRDVPAERANRDAALAQFATHLSSLQKDPWNTTQIGDVLPRIDASMREMVAEADLIFQYFEKGQQAKAGSRMATMDRKYGQLLSAVREASGRIQDIQRLRFANQLGEASGLRRFEYLIGALILVIVICVAFYGHHIGRVMRRAEVEREGLLKALSASERLAQTRLHDAIESMTEGFALYDAQDRLVMCNRRYNELFIGAGSNSNALPGMTFEEVIQLDVDAGRYKGIQGRAKAWIAERLRCHRECEGNILSELSNGRWVRIYDRRTTEGGIVVMVFDVTDSVRDERKLIHMAHHDALTELPNRGRFFTIVEELVESAGTSGDKVAIHYVDLDHFKRINDTLGHDAGDAVLREVANRLRQFAGPNIHPARLGGDEFAVVHLTRNDPSEVSGLAGSILEALGRPIIWKGHQLVVEASIGLSLSGQGAQDSMALAKNADLALYAAKNSGRNGYKFFDADIEQQFRKRRALEEAILRACENRAFELQFQPMFHLSSERLLGFEALIRLPRPDGTLIPPNEFIPVAEDMGKIDQVGSWVLDEACRTAANWADPLIIAVNLSPRQFKSGRLIDSVRHALERSRLPAHRLELEITETLLLEDSEAVQSQIFQLGNLGVKLALDDFGAGYSALNYLWRFPLDKIKIDRSFIHAMADNDRAKGILGAIVDLGHRLNLPITAEGVETAEQREYLTSLNCDMVQGYLFGRPARPADVAAVILRDMAKGFNRSPGRTEGSRLVRRPIKRIRKLGE